MSMQPLRVIFAGTPEFAIPSLQTLLNMPDIEVVAVYSQPDRKAGRGRKLLPTPIKSVALEHNIPVQTPLNFKDEADRQILANYKADLMVVAAYGLLLPQAVLDTPTYGCINVHASLLPRWRGAAPIQAAILAGDAETGVGIMRMEKGLDTGGIYCEKRIKITKDMDAGFLTSALASLGAMALQEAIQQALYKMTATPQASVGITYAHKIAKSDAAIDWTQPAENIQKHVNAYWPWPGAYTFFANKRLKIAKANATTLSATQTPGMVEKIDETGIFIATSNTLLQIISCQPEGKTLAPATQWQQFFKVGEQFTEMP